MSAPKFADSHNMVAFLAKPTKSDGFEQILDFLNAHPIKYALTVNPTIYTSCIEQFWATAKFNDPPLSRVNTLGSGEDRLKFKELMDLCSKLSDRVLDLEATKTAQVKEIAILKKRMRFGVIRRMHPKQRRKIGYIDKSNSDKVVERKKVVSTALKLVLLAQFLLETCYKTEEDRTSKIARREGEKKVEEAKTFSWDNVQAMLEADRLLDERLQAREQEELTNEEKARFQLLKEFDREDLENLWKLVKAKHRNTRPEEGYERVLCGDLKTMFEHHVEDLIWRNLHGKKVLLWRLYDSCGIHFVRFEDMHVYMLVEKRYPFTPAIITDMLNKKLQVYYWNEISILLGSTQTGQAEQVCLSEGDIYDDPSLLRFYQNDDTSPWGNSKRKEKGEGGPEWIVRTINKSETPEPEAPTFAITTRSGISTQDPPFLAPPRPATNNLTEGETKKEGSEGVEPSIIQEPAPRPSILYQPSKTTNPPFPSRLKMQIKDDEDERLLSISKQIHINLPFFEAMIHMPKGAKVLKDLLSHNKKIHLPGRFRSFRDGRRRISLDHFGTALPCHGKSCDRRTRGKIEFHRFPEVKPSPLTSGKSMKSKHFRDDYLYCADQTVKLLQEQWVDTINHDGKWTEEEEEEDSNKVLVVSFYPRTKPVESLKWKAPKKLLKPSSVEPPKLELKELPKHLEYAFLQENNQLPVVNSIHTIRDKKGTENLAADHLSRLEHPNLGKLTRAEIRDLFPEERLMAISYKNNEPWYDDYANYLASRVLPFRSTRQEKQNFFSDLRLYFWDEPLLFKQCADRIIRRCMAGYEAAQILRQCHSGPSGGHHSIATTARKVFEAGFYWPHIFRDARKLV
ncbi:hypothetical protein Tco_0441967 [Tanacetum coccineum]